MALHKIYLVATLQMLAWHTVMPLVPLYVVGLGGTAATVGLVAAITALAPLLLGVTAGTLVDRFKASRVMALGMLASCAGTAMLWQTPGLTAVMAAMILISLAQMSVALACQASIARLADPSKRAQQYGYFSFWVSLGMLIGPVAGGFLLDHLGFAAAFLSTFGWSVFGLLAIISRRAVNGAAQQQDIAAINKPGTGPDMKAMLRDPGMEVVLAVSFVILFAFSLRTSFLPIYLTQAGLSASVMGLLLSSQSLAAMAIRPFLGWANTTFGAGRLLQMALLFGIAGLAAIPLLTAFTPLLLACLCLGVANGVSQPTTMTLIATMSGGKGVAFGLRMSVQRLGQLLGPLSYGALIGLLGMTAAFWAGAAALLGAIALTSRVRLDSNRPIAQITVKG